MTTQTASEKRITLASLKKFIKENKDNLYAFRSNDFDGMTDCVQEVKQSSKKVKASKINLEDKNTLGIGAIWLVGSSRDWFKWFSDEIFEGIHISNCFGSSRIARLK